jgi:hypothetical protein
MYNLEYLIEREKEKKNVIYAIKSYQTELYYIGNTFDKLNKRMCSHRQKFHGYWKTKKYSPAFDILRYEDAYIEIIENHSGTSRYALAEKQRDYIRKNKEFVVNAIVGKSQDHKEELMKISKQRYDEKNKKTQPTQCK